MAWMYDINNKRKGDSGSMSMALWLDEQGEVQVEHFAKPRVGVCMRVGSMGGRSFHYQDWWQTSYIAEILEEKQIVENDCEMLYIKFKTESGSIYEWKS